MRPLQQCFPEGLFSWVVKGTATTQELTAWEGRDHDVDQGTHQCSLLLIRDWLLLLKCHPQIFCRLQAPGY